MADNKYGIVASFDSNGFATGNIKKEGSTKLSEHFKSAEFACPCCGEYKVAYKLLEGLEMMREILGKPMRIVNPASPGGQGYRCKKYAIALAARNKHAAVKTKHNEGTAADINARFSGVTPKRLKEIAEQIPQFRDGGIGFYTWGIHVDLGPKRRWNYA